MKTKVIIKYLVCKVILLIILLMIKCDDCEIIIKAWLQNNNLKLSL